MTIAGQELTKHLVLCLQKPQTQLGHRADTLSAAINSRLEQGTFYFAVLNLRRKRGSAKLTRLQVLFLHIEALLSLTTKYVYTKPVRQKFLTSTISFINMHVSFALNCRVILDLLTELMTVGCTTDPRQSTTSYLPILVVTCLQRARTRLI